MKHERHDLDDFLTWALAVVLALLSIGINVFILGKRGLYSSMGVS